MVLLFKLKHNLEQRIMIEVSNELPINGLVSSFFCEIPKDTLIDLHKNNKFDIQHKNTEDDGSSMYINQNVHNPKYFIARIIYMPNTKNEYLNSIYKLVKEHPQHGAIYVITNIDKYESLSS